MKRRLGAVVSVVMLVGMLGVPAAQAAPDRVLPAPAQGKAAVTALGKDFAAVAAKNHRSPQALKHLLETDSTMWLDQGGRLYVKDRAQVVPANPQKASGALPGPYPSDQTFKLHSKPGSSKKIYLNFVGATISGTYYNQIDGLPNGAYMGFDSDGSPSTYSASELNTIQYAFDLVSEDFAPFDVDVTTENPGEAALLRSSAADQNYGQQVLITSSPVASQVTCYDSCGGIAYLATFNEVITPQTPALVFPAMLGDDPRNIGETISHETGHTLNLEHDGTTQGDEYYEGQGDWAPIMGWGAGRALSHWSKGEYANASTKEDDLAIMQEFGLSLIADTVGNSTAASTALGTGTSASGLINTAADVDVFSFTRNCALTRPIELRPSAPSANLDAQLRLLNSAGQQVSRDDPPSGMDPVFGFQTGVGATIASTPAAGTYYLEVSGVGKGNPLTDGYSDYDSLGRYTLSIPECGADTTAPAVAQRSPAAGERLLADSGSVPVTVTFTESVTGVNDQTVVVTQPDGNEVGVWVGYDVTQRTAHLEFWPSSLGTYTVSLTGGASGIRDLSGNPLATTSWTFTVGQVEADLSVSAVQVSPANNVAVPTQQISWRVTVTNNGPDPASGVYVSAAGLAPLSCSGGCSWPTLASGGTTSFLVTGTTPATGATYSFATQVVSGTQDPNPGNNTASVAGTVSPFADIAGDFPFYNEVLWMSSSGVSTGYAQPDGSRLYKPLDGVSRAAMAAFMYRLAGSPVVTLPGASPFTDVSASHQFYKEIVWLSQQGITTGYVQPDGTSRFMPEATIARDAMAAFMYRYGGSPVVSLPGASPFTDVPASAKFYKEIVWMSQAGVTNGYAQSDGTRVFRPTNTVERAAMAAFMYRFAHRP